jgi:hypothetical protein
MLPHAKTSYSIFRRKIAASLDHPSFNNELMTNDMEFRPKATPPPLPSSRPSPCITNLQLCSGYSQLSLEINEILPPIYKSHSKGLPSTLL